MAKAHDVMILEDNPYGDLYYEGEPLPSIKSFDTDGIVLYAGSFSKVISPVCAWATPSAQSRFSPK